MSSPFVWDPTIYVFTASASEWWEFLYHTLSIVDPRILHNIITTFGGSLSMLLPPMHTTLSQYTGTVLYPTIARRGEKKWREKTRLVLSTLADDSTSHYKTLYEDITSRDTIHTHDDVGRSSIVPQNRKQFFICARSYTHCIAIILWTVFPRARKLYYVLMH